MNIKDKTRINVKKNIYLSLCMTIICLVFSLFVLAGSTWAWFSDGHSSSGNTITIGDYGISLSIQKMNQDQDNGLKMAKNSKKAEGITVHEMMIDSKGKHLVRIMPSNSTLGYCNLTITDENGNSLLKKDSLTIKIDSIVSFYIHTNKNVKVAISNVNWGSLVEYDELESDYYFSDFKFIYENGTVEYSELPEGFKEVSYIDSNGKQYTEDIVVNNNTIVDKTTFENRIVGKNTIIDEENQTIAYIYPCVDQNNIGGLYVFDLINKANKFYPNIGEGNFEIGEEVKHYKYELINKEDNVDLEYKDIIIEGKMDDDDTIYTYGIETEDKVKECAYKMEGFHFVGWKYEDRIIENLNDILTTIDPTSEQEIVLTVVWDIDYKTLIINGHKIDIKYRDELTTIDNLPEKEGYTFKGYYLADELIIDADGNFVKDPFDWSNSEKNEITLEDRWVVTVEKVDENNTIEKIDDIEIVEEETNEEDPPVVLEENNGETSNEEPESPVNNDEQGGTDE